MSESGSSAPARESGERDEWTAWQGDKQVSCPAIHPDVDEQCSLGYGHGEARRVTIYWDNTAVCDV